MSMIVDLNNAYYLTIAILKGNFDSNPNFGSDYNELEVDRFCNYKPGDMGYTHFL